MEVHEIYMRRALMLARFGEGSTGSNPMVGAVVVAPDGRVIGEGWHRRYGQGHAEVNAIASVRDADRHLLKKSTIYVTLEPCAHYGKTPPCAQLIIDTGIPNVVVGAVDPYSKVSGRGIAMLQQAGHEVVTGVLEADCMRLNAVFFTAHTRRRPFVLLKWAQTSDGYMGVAGGRLQISTPVSAMAVHRLRSRYGAILIGSGTAITDNPLLDSRLWPIGKTPRRAVIDRRWRMDVANRFFREEGLGDAIYFSGESQRPDLPVTLRQECIAADADSVHAMLDVFYRAGITSVMIEGGASLLDAFIARGVWDAARVETNPRLGIDGCAGVEAPCLCVPPVSVSRLDGNIIQIFANNPLVDVKNL